MLASRRAWGGRYQQCTQPFIPNCAACLLHVCVLLLCLHMLTYDFLRYCLASGRAAACSLCYLDRSGLYSHVLLYIVEVVLASRMVRRPRFFLNQHPVWQVQPAVSTQYKMYAFFSSATSTVWTRIMCHENLLPTRVTGVTGIRWSHRRLTKQQTSYTSNESTVLCTPHTTL